ncbi:MAG TPA: site-specific DNA-methyltransferase, partial [Candidatus Hydrogenedentes bacterium]|nr:site-specific DNA-methyltransferase [Candidatus Hydrogenedentota bacterium]
MPYYAGQVKCIYIDPPYNTGNENWVYNDAVNSPEIRNWLGKAVGGEAEDLSRHDKWLCMMYPRVNLLRYFLREDGVLFASIDDTEVDHLRFILDEIFGRGNRIGTIEWKNATDNNPTRIVPEHEYVLCYARSIGKCSPVWKADTSDVKQKLLEIGNELCAKFSDPDQRQAAYSTWLRKNKAFLSPMDRYKFIDENGVYTGSQSVHNPGKEGYRYDVLHPKTGKPCKQPLMGYRFPQETMSRLLEEGRVLFGEDESKIVELKVYAKDYRAKLSSVFELDGRTG